MTFGEWLKWFGNLFVKEIHVLYRSGFQVYFDRAFDYSDFFVRLHRNI